ncbi:extracellular solute-binding protein [Actinosynnema sp. NPDC047251]|uniref:Putative sugar binding secreted protein n=1 Tax=Saccharothrix espanaensis (strain ATCC 51144 / DSM 44229 / JCM 9112 / NBRC 15066 / NRRL 15764) TaxID=1179773 RepID=K0K4E4_SACES|nr:extracellular solute-binding protein [Saccharothrix espanaensis]CCH32477.1 putative sugar binding secreted protein [Saccharothrix espanaensis DSM 44229]
MQRAGRALWLVVALVLAVAGCGADADADGRLRLTVATFGEFGYGPLFEEYERAHPEVEVVGRVTDYENHHKGLITALSAGRGAADVVAVEEQYMPRLRRSTDRLADLSRFGADRLRERWVPWKWAQGVSDDGKSVLGLGTDMGGLAMCYRRDLFERAGLPTDRDRVAALWPTWEDYAGVADLFAGRVADSRFADSVNTVYTAVINQAEENYFAKADDSFIADVNPNVKRAFVLAGALGAKGRTAKVATFTQPWNAALNQGGFATVTCPAWMLAQIKEAAGPGGAGKWDVTAVPGGGGNWGGSYLTVPAQGAHQQEAYRLAEWLTAPEQQRKLFVRDGILPSQPEVYRDPAVLEHKDPYFGEAPLGKLFAASSDTVRPNHRGVRDADVRPVFGRALGRVEDGAQTVEQAWEQAVREARDALR